MLSLRVSEKLSFSALTKYVSPPFKTGSVELSAICFSNTWATESVVEIGVAQAAVSVWMQSQIAQPLLSAVDTKVT